MPKTRAQIKAIGTSGSRKDAEIIGADGTGNDSSDTDLVMPKRQKRKRGVNHRKMAAARKAAQPPFIFPHCKFPPPNEFAAAIPIPLPENDISVFTPDTTYEKIASRLLRLMVKVPYISLFPYPIVDVKKPAKRRGRDRGGHKKGGDDKFSFTASSMMAWEKGEEKKVRMGIFVGTQPRDSVGHTWAIAIVDVEEGKMVVIYDSDAKLTYDAQGEILFDKDLHAPQRDFLNCIKSTKKEKAGKINVKYLMWGGHASLSNESRDKCLENTLRWMESCEDRSTLKRANLKENGFVFINYNPSPTARQTIYHEVQNTDHQHGETSTIEPEEPEYHEWDVSSDSTVEDPNDEDYVGDTD
ncbi:hypothetical protein L486_03675 [Kwoniella mangroviensis CBS 10435]|uniref:Uncharacterized protein n=1 Tax=Kwoniella mangroviensis CBS 10435 TaxID=1331196 RepID=A0A1B9IUS3_9TREE|nr:uncharacterized protein I203_02360 [Kwoniella mangroviensis CBS 8507]OCF59174.1 hypothetical protein L486_03675 [Kwoniella mangroviensis CBS 10435]OCF68966.1 hypothetical protein I203_02360 [Kwoniella mangroviensis CBS 8507]